MGTPPAPVCVSPVFFKMSDAGSVLFNDVKVSHLVNLFKRAGSASVEFPLLEEGN